MYTRKLKIKTSSVNAWRSLCWWLDLSDCLITSSISQSNHRKSPPTTTAKTMARHVEKTSAGRAKMLSGGDTGDRLAEVELPTWIHCKQIVNNAVYLVCIGWNAGDAGNREVEWRQVVTGFMHERNEKSTETAVYMDWNWISRPQLQCHPPKTYTVNWGK